MKRYVLLLVLLIVTCVSCESYAVKKAVKSEVEEFGLEVNKVEVKKGEDGVYEGKVYLNKAILGLVNVIPVEAEKVDNEWVVSLDY